MSREYAVTGKRDDARALLEQIAAAAGDPPEHGLDGVKARRRRRMRHRRGAVATAMALAVLAVVALPWVTGAQKDHDVTAASADGSPDGASGPQAELPDVVELECEREAISVPVASIRPQDDGLHLDVVNRLGTVTDVWVLGEAWSSGRFRVPPGRTGVVLAAPPGGLTVGCDAGDTEQQRHVDLVDVEEVYTAPTLDCDEGEVQVEDAVLSVPEDDIRSMPTAVREGLPDHEIPDSDQMRALSGYPDGERLWTSPTADPVVQVKRHGETVAWVHLGGTVEETASDADGADAPAAGSVGATVPPTPRAPWTTVQKVELCPAFVAPPAGAATPGGQA